MKTRHKFWGIVVLLIFLTFFIINTLFGAIFTGLILLIYILSSFLSYDLYDGDLDKIDWGDINFRYLLGKFNKWLDKFDEDE